MGEGSKLVLDYSVNPFKQNGVFRLKEFVTRVGPLLNRLLYEFPRDDERIIVGQFTRFGSTFRVRDRIVERGYSTYCSAKFMTSST